MAFLREFLEFAKTRKRFIIVPIFLVLALLGMLLIFAETSAVAPFVYTLF